MGAISGHDEASSIMVSAQICTTVVFRVNDFLFFVALDLANVHLICHGPHKSTDNKSKGFKSYSCLIGNCSSFTTFVNLFLLQLSQLLVNSFAIIDKPGHVKLLLTLSSNLLPPGCIKFS